MPLKLILNPDTVSPPEHHQLVRELIFKSLVGPSYANLDVVKQAHRLYHGLRLRCLRAEAALPHRQKLFKRIRFCRPYGGLAALYDQATHKRVVALKTTCGVLGYCPFCYARQRLLPAYEHLSSAPEPLRALHGAFIPVAVNTAAQTRQALLQARKELLRLLKAQGVTSGIAGTRLFINPASAEPWHLYVYAVRPTSQSLYEPLTVTLRTDAVAQFPHQPMLASQQPQSLTALLKHCMLYQKELLLSTQWSDIDYYLQAVHNVPECTLLQP